VVLGGRLCGWETSSSLGWVTVHARFVSHPPCHDRLPEKKTDPLMLMGRRVEEERCERVEEVCNVHVKEGFLVSNRLATNSRRRRAGHDERQRQWMTLSIGVLWLLEELASRQRW
jgi:hypothetical protein